jgi:POT family proton-dependent oligopeptide transporter
MGINFGAFLAPLVCGTLAVKYGFKYGFAAAGIGMLSGLLFYKLFENKLLGDNGLHPIHKQITAVEKTESLSKVQIQQLTSLIILIIFTIPFWISFEQAGSSLTLFAEYATNRKFLGYEIPTGYFQALNPLFIITLAPLISLLWEKLRQKDKEPTSAEKFAVALFLMTIAYIILAFAGYLSAKSMISPLWLVAGYFIMTLSELCLSPIGLSLVSKLAPKQFLSLSMGGWFLMCFSGNLFAGLVGGEYEKLSHLELFGGLASLAFLSFVILLFFIPKLNKTLSSKE